jgi:hypothetical protein
MKPDLLKRLIPWLLLLLVALAAATLRYGFIEPSDIAHACDAGHGPAWCGLRQQIVLGFLNDIYGYVALAGAALALLWRRTWVAWLAAALGIVALQLYCYDAGAFALLVGSLRLVRLQAGAAPGDQHRHGEREIQPQP